MLTKCTINQKEKRHCQDDDGGFTFWHCSDDKILECKNKTEEQLLSHIDASESGEEIFLEDIAWADSECDKLDAMVEAGVISETIISRD